MRRRLFAPFLFSALIAGCYHERCYDCGPDVDPYVYESEPNDQACCANVLGTIAPYETVAIRGSMSASFPDFFDGFAFRSAQPIDVRVELWSDDPNDDFDVCIYDPLIGDFVVCFETAAQPEVGLFSVLETGREFHVVVTPYSGTGGYTLYVDAFPLSLAQPASDGGGIAAAATGAAARERALDLSDYHPPLASADAPRVRVVRRELGEIVWIDEAGELQRVRTVIERSEEPRD